MNRRPALLAAAVLAALPLPAAAQSLDQVMQDALANSPALEAAQARADAADATLEQARAEGMPSASLQGQVGIGRIDPQGFFTLAADDVTPRVAQVEAEWPLLTFGRVGSAIEQARAGQDLAAVNIGATALHLRLQVVESYSKARAARELVSSNTALSTSRNEVLRQAQLKFEAGEGTRTEIAQAQARLAGAEAALAQANGDLAAAEAQLAMLAGYPVDASRALPSPPAVPATREEALALAMEANPTLRQARHVVRMADAAIRAARAETLPAIAAYAEASSVRDQFFPGYKADSASLGVRGRWRFYSGGRASAATDRAQAEARAAEADVRVAEQLVRVRTVQAFEAVQAARLALAATQAQASATLEALRATRLEVEVGEKPQIALLDAEREASMAETARIRAEGDLLVASYTLRNLTGME
ncbi:TolC family protein [Aurantiacibacter poecillastricola]|uniref:TolC family protein n=1 Tax=Aurantiacibacter poecillastricola TaxID=3064385 RepID=UPI00273DE5FE|nr:TolC family protein [Aurantiacibacter sp. 219JJ12-13]MDP5261112.1 TolC family protein [Aurantiacibacter sp. 219JJ12-13]